MVSSRENLQENFSNHSLQLEKIMKCCRVCLDHDKEMNYIFQDKISCDIMNISDRLIYCTGVEIEENDGLPSQICSTCYNNLETAYQFKRKFLEAENTLRRLLLKSKYNIKCEYVDPKDDVDSSLFDDGAFSYENNLKAESVQVQSRELHEEVIIKDEKKDVEEEDHVSGSQTTRVLKGSSKGTICKKRSKRLWCNICELDLKTRADAKEHRKSHQKNVTWVCEICGKVFRHRASHITHLKSHRPPRFSCDQCDYRTSHKHDLAKHIRIHSGIKRYQCSYCPSSFHVISNLKSHERRTHQRVRDHICPVCSRLFFDMAHLKRHIDSHNEVKRFTCDICGSAYSRRCYWVKHMERQHEQMVQKIRPGRQKTNFVIKQGEGETK